MVIFSLLGGILGLAGAVIAVVVFDLSVIGALFLWSGTGFAFVALGIALALRSHRRGERYAATQPAQG